MQQRAARSAALSGGQFTKMGADLANTRAGFQHTIKSMQGYDLRTGKMVSQTETFTKALKEQKVHLGELMRSQKLMSNVIREQIDLRRAYAVSWSRDDQGRILGDLIIPKDNLNTKGMRAELSKMRAVLGSYAAAFRSASDQMVKWGKNTQWAGRQLMVGFTVPMGIAAAATGKMAYDVDKALTQITKVYGDATQEFQDSSESIRKSAWETAKNMTDLYGQSAQDTLEIEAQFAAAGKQGVELQQATAAATRARMLNEIDLQTAIDASITMQTVYGYSAEELGQKWDYINAVANQTILSAEDFATAIPKVAGVIHQLGGELEDVGTLMAGFRAAGIDAAEGANALKTISFRSVAAYDRGLATFKEKTGVELRELINQTNGETIPTLTKMWEAMSGLNVPDRVKVVKDVFGIYQGNKALMLLQQLAEGGEQVDQALAVGMNTVAENALIANQELQRMNEQPYKQIEKAIQNIKNAMAEMGAEVLPVVATIVEKIQAVLEAFNNWHGALKTTLAGAAVFTAIAGPITMLAGLFVNLIGNVGKFVSLIGVLTTRWKFLTAEEQLQNLVAKKSIGHWDRQSSAIELLTIELHKATNAMREYAAVAAGVPILDPRTINSAVQTTSPVKLRQDAQGRLRNSRGNFAKANTVPNALPLMAPSMGGAGAWDSREIDKQNTLLKEQASRYQTIASRVAAVATAAGFMGAMFGGSNGIVQGLSTAMFLGGSMLTMFPKIGASIITNMANPIKRLKVGLGAVSASLDNNVKGFSRFSGAMKSSGSVAKSAFAGLGSILKGSILPLTLIAAGVALFWKKAKDDAEEAAKNLKAVGNSTEAWSQMFGYNEISPSEMAKSSAQSGKEMTTALAAQFREANAEAADYFLTLDKGAKNIDEKWAVAINEGLKVKLTGGTVDAAKQATRTAMQMMGQRFEDADFEVQIDAKINFEDAEDQIEHMINFVETSMNQAVRDRGAGWDKWARNMFMGNNDLTQAASERAKQAGEEFYAVLAQTSEAEQGDLLREMDANLLKPMQDIFARTDEAASGMNFGQFVQNFRAGLTSMNKEDLDAFGKYLDYYQQFSDVVSASAGYDVPDLHSLIPKVDPQYMQTYYRYLMDASRAGVELSDANKLIWLNSARAKVGLGPVKDLADDFHFAADGAAKSAEELAAELDQLGTMIEKGGFRSSADQIIDSYRSVIEGVQSDAISYAMDSIDREADVALDAFDKSTKALEDSFGDASDRLEARHEKQQDAFDKKWDGRKNKVEEYYDKRIEKIEEQIKAEQKADEERQRMFEREKNRLERLADLFNSGIDISSAISTGNFDEAAKLTNDVRAKQDQWALDDAAKAAGEESDRRIDELNEKKDYWEEAKDARLDLLDQQMKAEEDALEKRQEMEKKALQKSQEFQKEELASKRASLQRQWEARKRALQTELDTIKAYVPRNEEELKKQVARIQAVYKKYGVNLKAQGKDWSTYIADSMTTQVERAGRELKTEIGWKNIGNKIAQQLLKGGFGMTPTQFAKWLNGGKAPSGSIFNPRGAIAGQDGRVGGITQHTGGIIGRGKGSRVGHTGGLDHSEVNVTALYGEAVLNKKATDWLGPEGVRSLNSRTVPQSMESMMMDKRMPKSTGGWMEMFTGIGAAGVAGSTKNLMGTVLGSYGFLKDKYKGKYDYGLTPTVGGGDKTITNLPPNSGGWIKPLKAYSVTSEWGMRKNPVTGIYTLHGGIDMAAPTGTPIYASKSGTVTMSGMYPGWGNYVRIAHNGGYSTGYAHQQRIFAREGQYVRRGQKIGLVNSTGNSTGPHLHFEEYLNGRNVNPRHIIPRLMEGGYTMNTGIAELHPKETVLTQPLSQDLKTGLNRLANGQDGGYNVTVDMRYSTFEKDIDVKKAVSEALQERDRKASRGRRVGAR